MEAGKLSDRRSFPSAKAHRFIYNLSGTSSSRIYEFSQPPEAARCVLLRAVITAADYAAPVANPKTVLELETAGTKFMQELCSSSAIGRVWHAQPVYARNNAGKLNLELPEVVEGNAGETAWAKSLIDGETSLSLVGKMKRGTHGAWLARDVDGENQIFKYVSNDDVRTQLQLAADSASAVNTAIARTPQFRKIGYVQDKGSWYTQEFLPGIPAPAPTQRLSTKMMLLNDQAAGKALKGGMNWSEEVMGALYKDSKGWQKNIAASGEEGRSFVEDVQSMVAPNRFLNPTANDIVHGDFQHYNALVDRKGRLSAYVDWEGAGKGDRGIDLSRLLYDSYVSEAEIGYKADPWLLQMMHSKLAAISGIPQRDNYMSYWALQVADFGLKRSPEQGSMFIGVGRRLLEDLRAGKKAMSTAA